MTDPRPPLTCARLRALATGRGLFADSPVVIRLRDGTLLEVVEDEAAAPTCLDKATGKPRLAGVPTLTLTVERVYP